ISGIVLVAKPAGPTSHDVVDIVRRALGEQRVGHLGTLDPFAKGLLVVVVGRATRLAAYAAEWPKSYEGVIRLGVTTETDDLTGPVVATASWTGITPAQLAAVIGSFRGGYEQRPPAYSAVKIGGERAYARARRGETVEPAPRPVEIRELEIVEAAVPDLHFRATVSGGTYLRSLARDIGAKLGCGAHLAALRRTAVGPLQLEDAVAPEAVTPANIRDAGVLVAHLPRREVNATERDAVLHGRSVKADPIVNSQHPIALFSGTELLAVAEQVGELLKPRTVVAGD
ncbi:MAG TPA: tRNA pseudouridine(55) synthase TruB, partial [Gemmatimonadales bacterium]|nr:tRNA pseudouridine(55) synthase TruB [Gemmatimonadales bacterium]